MRVASVVVMLIGFVCGWAGATWEFTESLEYEHRQNVEHRAVINKLSRQNRVLEQQNEELTERNERLTAIAADNLLDFHKMEDIITRQQKLIEHLFFGQDKEEI